MRSSHVCPSAAVRSLLAGLLVTIAACAGEEAEPGEAGTAGSDAAGEPAAAPPTGSDRIVELLAAGEAVFGMFSGERTPEQAATVAANRETDFVFYSLESGPFDLETMRAYNQGMRRGAGDAPVHPVALRIPPIGDDREGARDRARRGLEAGVSAIVFPHVASREDARLAVEAMGEGTWPADPEGGRTAILIVEDREGIANAEGIVRTPGVGVVIPGPGDLSRAYEGDATAVEEAIQTVLALCLEHGVPCGITAGVDDVARRLEEGFRLIIVTEPEALAVGREAAGRTDGP